MIIHNFDCHKLFHFLSYILMFLLAFLISPIWKTDKVNPRRGRDLAAFGHTIPSTKQTYSIAPRVYTFQAFLEVNTLIQ